MIGSVIDREKAELLQMALGTLVWDYDYSSQTLTVEPPSHRLACGGNFEAWLASIADPDRNDVRAALDDAFKNGLQRLELSYRMKAGEDFVPVRHLIAFKRDGAGKVQRALGVVEDISPDAQSRARAAITDRMASIGLLAAGVAHEINNPLAYILSNLRYAIVAMEESAGLPALVRQDIEEPLRDALDGAEKVRVIVKDLKAFSRPDTDERGSVDLRTVMESTITMCWNEIRHRARLVKNFDDVPPVLVSESRVAQVFLNLLVNAAHAIEPGHANKNRIQVSISQQHGRVVVRISDTGCGIRDEERTRIFDAFYTTKSKGVGTGLGLAICKEYVTQMGGEITFESKVGVGTDFIVSIPVHVDATVAAPVARPRVMLIDDDANVLRSLQRSLSSEYDVLAFDDGRKALEALRTDTPDLILCDMMMPHLSGRDFYHRLREQHPRLVSRLVFITGSLSQEGVKGFLDAVEMPRLEKPFERVAVASLLSAVGKNPPTTNAKN